jgi:hypothetical protein
MISTTVSARIQTSQQALRIARSALAASHAPALGLRYGVCGTCHSQRLFSTTPAAHLRDFFPAKDTPHILKTKPAWPHHGYTMEEMRAVVPAHRKPEGVAEWAAWKFVRIARFWMDLATGVRPEQQVDKKNPTTAVVAPKPLTEAQWVRTAPQLA